MVAMPIVLAMAKGVLRNGRRGKEIALDQKRKMRGPVRRGINKNGGKPSSWRALRWFVSMDCGMCMQQQAAKRDCMQESSLGSTELSLKSMLSFGGGSSYIQLCFLQRFVYRRIIRQQFA